MHQASEKSRSQIYQIKIQGFLDKEWADWFDGFSITHEPDGTTMLSGSVADQSALHGLLIRLRNLGMSLISVNPDNPRGKDPGRSSNERREK